MEAGGTGEGGNVKEEPVAGLPAPAAPTETPAALTETPAPSTETPAAPTEAPAAPTETLAEPSETLAAPTETPAEPSETLAAPTETPAERIETPAEPCETLAEPSETLAAPTETPAAPTETPAEPSETPAADGGEGTDAVAGDGDVAEKFEDATSDEPAALVMDEESLARQREWEQAHHAAEAQRQAEEAQRKEEAVVQMDGYREGRILWRAELERQMRAWRDDPEWHDEAAQLAVSTPKGTFCQLDCQVTLALPPDAVYNTLCDPYNRRVFKNIKAVKHRKVLEDDGDRQLVEVEQSAAWRFLVFSGAFDTRLLVTQDRAERTMSFKIAQPGFMRRFEGFWRVEPLPVPGSADMRTEGESKGGSETAEKGGSGVEGGGKAEAAEGEAGRGAEGSDFEDAREAFDSRPPAEADASEGDASREGASEAKPGHGARMASRVHLQQVVQLALSPPPPLDYYVRGITAQVVRDMLGDFQVETRRVRYGGGDDDGEADGKAAQEGVGGRIARMSAAFLHREALGGKSGKGKGMGWGKKNGAK